MSLIPDINIPVLRPCVKHKRNKSFTNDDCKSSLKVPKLLKAFRNSSCDKTQSLGERNLLSPTYTELSLETTLTISLDRKNISPRKSIRKLKRSKSINLTHEKNKKGDISTSNVRFLNIDTEKIENTKKTNLSKQSPKILSDLSNNFFSDSIESLKSSNLKLSEPEEKKEQNEIYEPTFEQFYNQTWLTSGSINHMIEFMISSVQNTQWIHTFLLTYNYICTSSELIKLLICKFKEYPFYHEEVNLPQLRIIRILIRWKSVKSYSFQSLSSDTHQYLRKFIRYLKKQKDFPIALHWANELKQDTNFISVGIPMNKVQYQSDNNKKYDCILKIPSKKVAEQLTLIDHEFLCNIPLKEFTKGNWMKSRKDKLAPNILAFAKHFNHISNWVATEILIAPTNIIRKQILEHFIDIESYLHEIDNFNGLMCIHAGLNFHEIQRLKPLWKNITEKRLRKYNEIEELLSPLNNFQNYRNILINIKPPFIPFQSRLLGDLTTIEQNILRNTNDSINFYKLTDIGQILKIVELAQSVKYPFTLSKQFKHFLLEEIFVISKGVMFALSEHCLNTLQKKKAYTTK